MRLPWVSRKLYEIQIQDLTQSWQDACAAEASALVKARRAEIALQLSFGLRVEDLLTSDTVEYRLHVAHIILRKMHGDPRHMIADRLHDELDRIIRGDYSMTSARNPLQNTP